MYKLMYQCSIQSVKILISISVSFIRNNIHVDNLSYFVIKDDKSKDLNDSFLVNVMKSGTKKEKNKQKQKINTKKESSECPVDSAWDVAEKDGFEIWIPKLIPPPKEVN